MTDDQMRSADEAMHEEVARMYREQVLQATAKRDGYPDNEAYKNRYLIHCKLDPESYSCLWAYAKAHGLSINRASKQIIQAHFNIQPKS